MVEDREEDKVVERTAAEMVKKGIPEFYVYHMARVQQFYLDELKIPAEKFRIYQLDDSEKAFYNKYHFDLEIDLHELGFTEMGGIHYRTDHDLVGHQKISKQSMEIFDEESASKFIPHVLELSFGSDRNTYALLDLAYHDDTERGNVVLKFAPKVAPFYCAVFPLVKNNEAIIKLAKDLSSDLKCYSSYYDEVASVGRRYARADEIGVKYCITVDFDSLEDNAVTIRERDSTTQIRVKIPELKQKLFELFF